jgi:predicted amidohydrolase YtcJ
MTKKNSFFGSYFSTMWFRLQCLTIVAVFVFVSCSKPKADLLLFGSKIYTVNEQFDTAEAIALRGDSILAIGSLKELRSRYDFKEEIDYSGKYIYPGFIDAHCHFYGLGRMSRQVDLNGTRSWKEVVERCVRFMQEHPNISFLTGMGWDQNKWTPGTYPVNDTLNLLFPNMPVVLKRVDGHAAIANDFALKMAGFTAGTRVAGGRIMLQGSRLTGVVIDNAVDMLDAAMPLPSLQEQAAAYETAEKICIAYGLTSLHDAGQEPALINLLDSLQRAGKIFINVYQMVSATPATVEHYISKGPYRSEHMSIRSFKLYGDGSLGSRGACLLEPYSDEPQRTGFLRSSPGSIEAIVKQVAASSFQLNTHCIGDSANRLMLKLYGKYTGDEPDRRWRIEHAQVLSLQDIELFGRYTIVPSVQPAHATSDMQWAGQRLGPVREQGAYAYRQLLEQNAWLPLGTDFPVESPNPMFTFYAAVARKDAAGVPENGYFPAQALTREQALKGMTIWAALAAFEENDRGSLERGKRADLTILDTDLMKDDLYRIRNAKVAATFISGKQVYKAPDPK